MDVKSAALVCADSQLYGLITLLWVGPTVTLILIINVAFCVMFCLRRKPQVKNEGRFVSDHQDTDIQSATQRNRFAQRGLPFEVSGALKERQGQGSVPGESNATQFDSNSGSPVYEDMTQCFAAPTNIHDGISEQEATSIWNNKPRRNYGATNSVALPGDDSDAYQCIQPAHLYENIPGESEDLAAEEPKAAHAHIKVEAEIETENVGEDENEHINDDSNK